MSGCCRVRGSLCLLGSASRLRGERQTTDSFYSLGPRLRCSFPFNDPGRSRCSFCEGRSWIFSNNSAVHFTCVDKLSYFFHWHPKKSTDLKTQGPVILLFGFWALWNSKKSLRRPVEDDKCLSCQKDWTPFPRGHRGTVLVPLPWCR